MERSMSGLLRQHDLCGMNIQMKLPDVEEKIAFLSPESLRASTAISMVVCIFNSENLCLFFITDHYSSETIERQAQQ